MSHLEPPATVSGIERLTNERRTTAGVAHDIHVALTDPLRVDQAEQRLRADWPHQSSWPLSFEPAEGTAAPKVVLGWVPDDRQDEAVEALRGALDRLQRT
ncbi:hypothetical protein [Pedococcus bigeumensis]|uniref:Uncharacterized protein n=1 Tax=Pedococcus bigeumensis TaxID=433644 RepID=A0A502CI66_9MICO|nr:hypothetical protein [Pedococcus bigeumensis]TPG12513.1 hypothetical protein EAH86_20160 [Pedococcus bigeumensis]